MGVREDCRHYSTRTTGADEVVQRCRLGANEAMPFACPDGCLFFEPRAFRASGWTGHPDSMPPPAEGDDDPSEGTDEAT